MIKTLYFRVVLIFLTIVIVSLILASSISFLPFKNQQTLLFQNELLTAGNNLSEMIRDLNPSNLDDFLKRFSNLYNYSLSLYNASGERKDYGKVESEMQMEIRQADITSVLKENVYVNRHHAQTAVGIPLEVSGTRYALFLYQGITPQIGEFVRTLGATLVLILLIGSVLIVVASRYIVKPLQAMTAAIKRLAKGDFNVQVKVKRRDELGILAESFNHMASELKQLERMRQDFVSNVSHEIQTPLTSIRGFSKALQNEGISEPDRKRYLNIIEQESVRLARLSDNLLKLASLESEHHPFHPTHFSLDEQLRRIVVANEPLWLEKELDIQLELIDLKITGDADQLNQVWTNLLNNSMKFTPHGGKILIELKEAANGIQVLFSDTGMGIRPEDRERIFERFYKSDASRQIYEGSGLGLAIVKKIVDIHQGEIEIGGKFGQGADFTITLPSLRKAGLLP
jgi:signal transduction histidine kinase